MNKPQTTLADWESQGLAEQQGAAFAQDIQAITPLALFTRAMPGWVDAHQTAARITIDCVPGMGGAAIQMSFGADSLPVEVAQDLLDRLGKTSRLMELENQIELLRGTGGHPEVINKLVSEAENLAEELSP